VPRDANRCGIPLLLENALSSELVPDVNAANTGEVRSFLAALANDDLAGHSQGNRIAGPLHRGVSHHWYPRVLPPEVLQRRLLLCLYGLGTNAGLKRMCSGGGEDGYDDLHYVRRRYITKEQLRAAIPPVCNAIFRVRNPALWGEGTTACASDSKKFGAWDQNLITEWHARYGAGTWRRTRSASTRNSKHVGRMRRLPAPFPNTLLLQSNLYRW
jgi:Tn3 transposase DDE domain